MPLAEDIVIVNRSGLCPFPDPDMGACGADLMQVQGLRDVGTPYPATPPRAWACTEGHVFVQGKVVTV